MVESKAARFEEQIKKKAEDIEQLKAKLEVVSLPEVIDYLKQSIIQESDILERIKASYQEYLDKIQVGKELSINSKDSVKDGYWPLYKQDVEFKTEDE